MAYDPRQHPMISSSSDNTTNVPNQPITSPLMFTHANAASHVTSVPDAATRDALAQMAQLSMSTEQQQLQQSILFNHPQFQGHVPHAPNSVTNGHFPLMQQTIPQSQQHPSGVSLQHPMPMIPFIPGHVNPQVSIPHTTSPDALQGMYRLTSVHQNINPSMIGEPFTVVPNHQASGLMPSLQTTNVGRSANSIASGVPMNTSVHGVHPSHNFSSPHQLPLSPAAAAAASPSQQQQIQQQIFGYDQEGLGLAAQTQGVIPVTGSVVVTNQSLLHRNVQGRGAVVAGVQPEIAAANQERQQAVKTQLNALPHTLPTVLNLSLQTRRTSASGQLASPRNDVSYQGWDLNPSTRRVSGSDDPAMTSPRSALFYQSWDDDSTSGTGSSICSPTSPSTGWGDYVLPVYETPADKDVCLRCYKKVYVVERIGPVKAAVYHKNCFTCAECGTKLTMSTFHHNPNDMGDINVYCKSHAPKTRNIGSEADAYYIQQGMKSKGLKTVQMEQRIIATDDPTASYGYLPYEYDTGDGRTGIVLGRGTDDLTGPAVTRTDYLTGPVGTRTNDLTDQVGTGAERDPQIRKNVPKDNVHITVTTIERPLTPSDRRSSAPTTGGSSPYSSVSSSSSYATNLKEDAHAESNHVIDRVDSSLVRSDRPSSTSSSVTSLDIVQKSDSLDTAKLQNGDSLVELGKRQPLISSTNLERQDRPSSTISPPQSSESRFLKNDPASRMIKSHSTHEFFTKNELRNQLDQPRTGSQIDRQRLDRPSQNN